jgi:hypothetical protein
MSDKKFSVIITHNDEQACGGGGDDDDGEDEGKRIRPISMHTPLSRKTILSYA